ncbi:hypothetical protein QAD02_008400 [Eretmocerus hayati]|uniref:Uncharacterized protein n=1 Tax=Eretmocerus hayati TaxID=131215 RepID=A0ACC2N7P9_9HYME|nr:hypothetical protein QAD02_008400 [Eretmocerus hayati]
MQIQHLPNVGDFYKIARAMINRYHPPITMGGADADRARALLERAERNNVVQRLAEEDNLATRNAQRLIRLDQEHLQDFPQLTIEYLRDLTTGIFQIKLSPSYIQDTLQREETYEFQIEMLGDANRLPEPGLLRARVYSRFRNAAKHQMWITYQPVGVDHDENINENADPITGYYCICRSGARTLGTCARVTSVLWYLEYARHEEQVSYPSQVLFNAIFDAAHRGPQVDPA